MLTFFLIYVWYEWVQMGSLETFINWNITQFGFKDIDIYYKFYVLVWIERMS